MPAATPTARKADHGYTARPPPTTSARASARGRPRHRPRHPPLALRLWRSPRPHRPPRTLAAADVRLRHRPSAALHRLLLASAEPPTPCPGLPRSALLLGRPAPALPDLLPAWLRARGPGASPPVWGLAPAGKCLRLPRTASAVAAHPTRVSLSDPAAAQFKLNGSEPQASPVHHHATRFTRVLDCLAPTACLAGPDTRLADEPAVLAALAEPLHAWQPYLGSPPASPTPGCTPARVSAPTFRRDPAHQCAQRRHLPSL